MKNDASEQIKVLHISDLHVGMSNQKWMWPSVKAIFLEDIRRLHAKTGPWDLVVFSGDLTQRAEPSEFAKVSEIILEIWQHLASLGSKPVLFTVPGNHDLLRPNSLNPGARALNNWWGDAAVRNAFWKKDPPDYFAVVENAFANYTSWLKQLRASHIFPESLCEGLLPGDSSTRLTVRGIKLGLVGLNSSWLQLTGEDYDGRLDIHPQQLNEVTSNDPDEWLARNDINLLVTHHPSAWLHETSLNLFRSEIYQSSRFDAHMFGHMHAPQTTSISEGGASPRRFIQAASLFGLEEYGSGSHRIHGYSLLSLHCGQPRPAIRVWPRLAVTKADGSRRIVENFNFDNDEDGAFDIDALVKEASSTNESFSQKLVLETASELLKNLQKTLPEEAAHSAVRQSEQGVSKATIESGHPLWIVSDWGMGSDQFVRSILNSLGLGGTPVYQVDLHGCSSKAEIEARFEELAGISFVQVCDQFATKDSITLILEDISVGERGEHVKNSVQEDIESIGGILRDYCPNLRLIYRSRVPPIGEAIKVIVLEPLDLADTAAYIQMHGQWPRQSPTRQFIEKLHRHTDGLPSRLDAALKDVQLVGTSELLGLDTDVAGKRAVVHASPPGLAETVNELQKSQDPNSRRAFDLLCALMLFPRGEQLTTVKRFFETRPFWPQDARLLVDAGLVDASELQMLGDDASSEIGSALVVRRQVRDFLYASLPEQELRALNKRAIAIYFGQDWSLKGIQSSKEAKFEDRNCGAWKIGNASILILRVVRETINSEKKGNNNGKIKSALDLASSYCTALMSGDRWSSIVSLCSDLLPLFQDAEVSPEDLFTLNGLYAKSLRMIGETDEARKLYEDVVPLGSANASNTRQANLLNLALCYERLGDSERALTTAKKCQSVSPRSTASIQAQTIILNCGPETTDKSARLLKLEQQALRKRSLTVASTLALERAEKANSVSEKRDILNAIMERDQGGEDKYNVMRATLRRAQLDLEAGIVLSTKLVYQVIDAYQYLYGENMNSLFRQSHDVLWSHFERTEDMRNLLSLFRHSSLIWRLRDQPDEERSYLVRLSARVGAEGGDLLRNAGKELAYFVARAQALAKLKLN